MCTNPVAPVVQPDFYSFVNSGRLGDADNVGQMAVIYTLHGQRRLAAAVLQDNVLAHTCHPEKPDDAGLELVCFFLLSKHAVACGDSCENDTGNLLVTKGDHYGVREKQGIIEVRNSGHPVMPSIPWTLNSRSLAEVEMWSAYMHVTGATGQAKSALTVFGKLHDHHGTSLDMPQGETGLGPTVMAGLFQANSSRIRHSDECRGTQVTSDDQNNGRNAIGTALEGNGRFRVGGSHAAAALSLDCLSWCPGLRQSDERLG
ncbi:Imidazole glycerol phosphate synthase hisHF [Porphyridium purpureum]|uniref:Imidazole glycerol phosphate synthase hisHF n=1 Tax=Porphyridium purpureum TaxID=35688 RepID=A0A5J4YQM0_PORPP|nr:Imidazole glycerol phosphate synthase hisHF [Porphyridium purpureum]|eukprot:POR1317..scf222_8